MLNCKGSAMNIIITANRFVRSFPAVALLMGLSMNCTLAAGVEITEFDTKKVLYDFKETAVLTGKIKNNDSHEVKAIAEVLIKKGVDMAYALPPNEITLPGGGETILNFKWDTDDREYGHAAFLKIKNKNGELLAESGPVVFEVCHDWRKIMRSGGIPVYHGVFDPKSDYSSEKYMTDMIKFLRDWGYNRMHFYASWQAEIDNLAPTEDEWHYWQYKEPTARENWKNQMISKNKIKEWIGKLHDNGIKATMYMHAPTWKLKDESWIVYDPMTGGRSHYPDPPERKKWLEEHDLGVPECGRFCADFGEQLSKAVQEYDWDGCFLDDYTTITLYTVKGVDKHGNRLTTLPNEEVHAAGLEAITKNVRPIKDNFVLMPNGLHGTMYGSMFFPSRNMFGENGEKFPLLKSGSNKNVALAGEWRSIATQTNSPWQLGRSLRAVKEATGSPIDIVWTVACPPRWEKGDAGFHGKDASYTYRVETVLPFTAVILSNGFSYMDYYTSIPQGIYTDIEKDEVARERVKYLKFAARYGQYLYDLDSHWTKKNEVIVDAPDHVYWKGNTFERKFKDRREIYMHLINFDKMYLAAKLWDRTRTVPVPADGISATIELDAGEKVTGAFAVSPDADPEPVGIPFENKDSSAKVVSPTLKYWNVIVVKIAKQKGD